MGLRSSDESGDTSGSETMRMLEQRGTLRRLVSEAAPYMRHDEEWQREAKALLAMNDWPEYEVKRR